MADYGGVNDGQCEFSFFVRCDEFVDETLPELTFGQQGGWRHRYCTFHYWHVKDQIEGDSDG